MSLVDADKVQSFSILPQSCGHCGVLIGFFLCLPCVSVHIYWLHSEMFLFSYCTCIQLYLVSWWIVYCKPNKMVMMLLLHCWYIVTCGFNTKTAGLMPLMAWMSGGPFEYKMDTQKKIKQLSQRIMLQTYQQFGSCYL